MNVQVELNAKGDVVTRTFADDRGQRWKYFMDTPGLVDKLIFTDSDGKKTVTEFERDITNAVIQTTVTYPDGNKTITQKEMK